MEKIVNSVLKVIMRLWDDKKIRENVGFKIIKDGISILGDKSILPRWVQKSTQLIFDKETLQYHYLDEEEKIESKRIKEIYRNLKKATNREMRLPELFDCFIKMSKVVAKDASYEVGDDMYLMQAEVVEYNRRHMFGFSLIRQIPYKEEFFQLRMQVLFELNEANRNMSHFCWNEDVEEDFFTYVQSTDAYKLGCEAPVYDVCIYLQET